MTRKIKPELEKFVTIGNGYITYDTDHQVLKIGYMVNGNKFSVLAVKVKKTKGKSHYSYGGSYYDWTISGFEVDVYGTDGTAETRIKELEAVAKQLSQNKADRQEELAGIVKLLMKETGKSYREVLNYAQDINSYRYSSEFENKCLQTA